MNKIIYETAEGSVSIIIPSGAITIEEVAQKRVPAGTTYLIVDESVFPDDRIFRDAWKLSGSSIYEDLELSRTIALDRIKQAGLRAAGRAQELEALFETPTFSSALIRTAYVECKATLTAATTVEELKNCLNTFTTTYEVDY